MAEVLCFLLVISVWGVSAFPSSSSSSPSQLSTYPRITDLNGKSIKKRGIKGYLIPNGDEGDENVSFSEFLKYFLPCFIAALLLSAGCCYLCKKSQDLWSWCPKTVEKPDDGFNRW